MLAPPPLPRNKDAALRDLSSTKAESRASAIVDLVRHARGDRETRDVTVPHLAQALEDEAPQVRAAAAVGLGDLAGVEALAALLVAIEDKDPYVRQMAINALGEIGDGRASPRLRRALEDPRPEVRYQATIAFPRVAADDPDAVREALARAFSDADESVRYIALRVAEERGEHELAGKARPLAGDPVAHVALAAAIFLAKAGDAGGREVVLSVVRGEGPSKKGPAREDEHEAILVAGALGLREAVPHLERRAWGMARLVSDTCAWSAKTALARMGHARAVAEIEADLDSRKRATLEAAVVAAGRARLASARPRLSRLRADDADPELVAQALAEIDGAPSRGSP